MPTGSVVFVDVLMGEDSTMGSEALFDTLEQSLRAARDSGHLTTDEYAATAYPTWFRTLEQLREPFSPTSAGAEEGTLELVSIELATLADPFLPAFVKSGDAAAYGQRQSGFLRGFLEPSFRAALPTRKAAEQTAIINGVFTDAAERIAADPHAVSLTYKLVAGRIRRAG